MTDDQFEKLLVAMRPKEVPFVTRLVQGTVLTLFPMVFTALGMLVWFNFTDTTGLVRDNQASIEGIKEVYKSELVELKLRIEGLEKDYEKLTDGSFVGPVPAARIHEPAAAQVLEKLDTEKASLEWKLKSDLEQRIKK